MTNGCSQHKHLDPDCRICNNRRGRGVDPDGRSLYKEAMTRCPEHPESFVNILYMSGEIAEAETLEEYIESKQIEEKAFTWQNLQFRRGDRLHIQREGKPIIVTVMQVYNPDTLMAEYCGRTLFIPIDEVRAPF